MNAKITPEVVVLAYKLILGRDPESRQAIKSHLHFESIESLASHMMSSQEFQGKIQQQQYANGSKWVSTEVLGQYTQWVDLHDRFVSYGCLNNNWEPSESDYFIAMTSPGDCVLDIGANIGWFTLLGAKYSGLKGTVHSFEPRPETSKMLKRTISDNELKSRVHVWDFALSNKWGTTDLA